MQNIHQKIINDTEPLLQDVTLFGKSESKGKDSSIRNNFHYPNSIPNNSIELALLERHICKTANISIEYAEPPVILRYEPGQYYKWHYDFIYPHSPEIKNQINQFGQRESTGIYYLSDNCEGGETEFKNLNVSIKPKSGNLVFFKNSDSDGNRNNNSLHKGAEVTKGTKWIVTLWFRSKPYWLRTGLF
jgi:prolyl 4-hydroxylase